VTAIGAQSRVGQTLQFQVGLMVPSNTESQRTAFTVTVDARQGRRPYPTSPGLIAPVSVR